MDDDLADELADIADRWEHGHDELVDGCALCIAEYAEALEAVQGRNR